MAPAVIPKVVHRCWFGPHRMPDRYRDHADEWRRYGYEVVDWNEATVDPVNRDVWDAIAEGVNVGGGLPETGVAVQRADIISYELVWRHGGIYANCDIRPLRDLHELLDTPTPPQAFGVVETGSSYVSNALMGAVPGHPFFGRVVEVLPARYHHRRHDPMNEVTGPHLLSDVHRERDDLTVLLDPAFPYKFTDMHLECRPDLWPAGDWWVEHRWGHQHPELVEPLT